MSGFFGCVSRRDCVADVFYGTDYHSHLGTKRAGLAFYNGTDFNRSIHSLESAYFRNKFEPELDRFAGSNLGIGVISDMESQPITVTSHLGRFAVVVVGRLANLDEIVDEFLKERKHFAELSSSTVNPTEAVAMLINAGNTFKEGIENVYNKVKGSCSFLILTETGIYAARDKCGGQRKFFVHESGIHDRAGYSAAGGFADYPGWDHASDDSGMQETDLFFLVGILRLPFFILRGD